MSVIHVPVLLNEIIDFINPKENQIILDLTLGFAGMSFEIAKRLNNNGKLICFDQDINAINYSKTILRDFKNVIIIHDNFSNFSDHLTKSNINKVDSIIIDLGVSLEQLTNNERGFSYKENTILDMRMNQENTFDAQELLNQYTQKQLEKILFEYGNESRARLIAQEIINFRKTTKIETSTQLNDIIRKVKNFSAKKHSLKNIYQALRIEVNNEIGILENTILKALEILKPGGKLAIITFHSLEDKVIKNIFLNAKNKIIETEKEYKQQFKTHKKIYPSKEEIMLNKSSRSARLRTITKIYD